MNDKQTIINFSTIEDKISDLYIMKNIEFYFSMNNYHFVNELIDSNLELVGWEYKSEDNTLIILFDHQNCANFYN